MVSSRKEENVKSAVTSLRMDGIRCEGTTAHMGIDADRKRLIEFAVKRLVNKSIPKHCTVLKHPYSSYGKLDILVSNAASNPHYGDMISVPDTLWEKMLSLNVKSAFQLAKEAIPHLESSGNGNIVFVRVTHFTNDLQLDF